jgi:uncharacterized protein YyaL (SSP411 family)
MQPLPGRNLLAEESSPYLRQHADNPVHWRPWSSNALAEARSSDRPILLSVGYAACHWCHVMAHESFEDGGVADVMNRLFVNIKVDREERPDIDQLYMAALTAMGEQGGWPLTMFLTPDGQPFWGGTYFPKEPRYGRPGFIQVLEAVSRTWNDKREDLTHSAAALTDHVHGRLAPASIRQSLTSTLVDQHCKAIAGAIDPVRGGLRGAPKFPNAPFMNLLWLSWLNTANTDHRDAVLLSLRQMLSGGIYDHLGGGLCRYSTDAEWLVPHFEKMLYDNAQLIELCCQAFAETNDPLFRVRIEETVTWLVAEMLVEGGGFASSLDADSDGEEGRFYVWTEHELRAVLGDADANAFLGQYILSKPPGWDGDPILHRKGVDWAEPVSNLACSRRNLLAHRGHRPRPGRDDKVLSDWNGLVVSALACAGRQFDRRDWIELAAGAFRFVSESHRDGRLPHAILGDSRLFPGMATDHAAMITAAVSLWQATGDRHYLDLADGWRATLERFYGDDAATGHFLTAADATDMPLRLRSDIDEATPSATAQIIVSFQKLATARGDLPLAERTIVLAENALGRAAAQPYGQAGLLHAAELVRQPAKLVVVDQADGELVTQANRFPDPRRIDVVLPLGKPGQMATLADGTIIGTEKPGAWLCLGLLCMPPVQDAAALSSLLRGQK